MWPQALSQGVVSLISKGEGSAPSKLRPISVMSVIYRAWAAGRVRDLTLWQQEWIADCLHGFRQGHSPEDVWWQMGLQVEDALLDGSDLMGFILDWSKCFDRVPIDIVLKLAAELGMPLCIHRGLEGMYHQLRRRFSLAGHLGKSFKASNGIIQGCPLSVMLLNVLMNIWARTVSP